MKHFFSSNQTVWISFLIGLAVFSSGFNSLNSIDDSLSVIIGQIELPVKSDPKLPKIQSPVDLSPIFKNELNKSEPKLIAVGGKLMAGFRDGGLFRAGQLTAFPNLIAHQMGLTNFTSPLFELEEGNGTGYLVLDTNQQYPTWKKVVNNLGIIASNPLRLNKYRQGIPDNLAFPELTLQVKQFANLNSPPPAYPQRYQYTGYFYRILPESEEGKTSLADILDSKQADIALFQEGYDLYLGLAQYPRNPSIELDGLFNLVTPPHSDKVIEQLVRKGTKVILFTVPQVIDFPYFHIHSIRGLLNSNKDIYARSHNNHPTPDKLTNEAILLPTDAVRALILGKSKAGLSYREPLADEDVISPDELVYIKSAGAYNDLFIRSQAKKYNLPVVDLEEIYKRILSHQYTTDDGLEIDPSFPRGNFFSSDGLNPSAIGQAVIANETIKVINQHYRTNIPQIQVRVWAALL